jgi:hypothetical protein
MINDDLLPFFSGKKVSITGGTGFYSPIPLSRGVEDKLQWYLQQLGSQTVFGGTAP